MAFMYYPNNQPNHSTGHSTLVQTNSISTNWPKTPIQSTNTLYSYRDIPQDRTWVISNPEDGRTIRSLSMPNGAHSSSTATFVANPRGPRRSTSMTRASRGGNSLNDSNASIPYVANAITSYPVQDFIITPSQGSTSPRPTYSNRAPTPPTPPEQDLRTALQKSIDSYKPLIHSATSTRPGKPRSAATTPRTKSPPRGSRSPPRSPRNNTSTPLPWSSPHRPIPDSNEPQYYDSVISERDRGTDLSSIVQRATPIKPEAIVFPNGSPPQIEYSPKHSKKPDPIFVEQPTYANPTLVVDHYESPTYDISSNKLTDFTFGSSMPSSSRFSQIPPTTTNFINTQDPNNRFMQYPNNFNGPTSATTLKKPNLGTPQSSGPPEESGIHKLLWFTIGLMMMLGSMFVSLVLSILDIKPKVTSTSADANPITNNNTSIKSYGNGKDAFSRSPYSNILANKGR